MPTPKKRTYDPRLSGEERYDLTGPAQLNPEAARLGGVGTTNGTTDYAGWILGMPGSGSTAWTAPPNLTGGGGGDGGGGGLSAEDMELDALIKKILADLDKPLDFNDPVVANILTGARTATLSDLASRGIHGGYSESNAQQSYINAASSLQDQKQARMLQALDLANNREFAKAKMMFEQQNYKYENDPARGIGALIGGGLGGFFGGALGGPAGAGIGFQAGSQLGAGAGGFFAPQPQMSWGGSQPSWGGNSSSAWRPSSRNSIKQY